MLKQLLFKIKKYTAVQAVFLVVLSFLFPLVSNALEPIPCPPGIACPSGSGVSGIGGVNELVFNIISWLLGIAFGVAVLFLIIGGFWFILSAGNEERAAKGKSTIINAVIGIVIIILSYAIISFVVGSVGNLFGGQGGQAP